jgi:Protein of unknown function (DUF3611)
MAAPIRGNSGVFGMFQKAFRPSGNDSLSQSFLRLGWLGFWMQVAVGAIPLALAIFALVFGPKSRPGYPRRLSLDRILVDCGPFGARIHNDVVLSLHAARYASRRSGATACDICRSADGMDWNKGSHDRDHVLDAGHGFRGRTTSDLFSARTAGRNSGRPNDWRSGKLGIRSRHSRVDGPPPHHVR